MRGYECFYKVLKKQKKKEVDVSYGYNTACWAGIKNIIGKYDSIYIERFREPETEKYIKLLLNIINKITPCKIVKINKVEYIKYTLISGYDNNLILLNFIRNLWNCPLQYAYVSGYNGKNMLKDYTLVFFETLSKIEEKDPLKMLIEANIEACKPLVYNHDLIVGPGHSNAFPSRFLKIKNVDELLKYEGTSVKSFLTEN